MREEEKHIKHERRQEDLITEFVRLGLRLRALLNQWEGLRSLSGMRKKSTSISYKNEFYTSIMKNGRKCRTQEEKRTTLLRF